MSGEPIVCPSCPKTFTRAYDLKRHEKNFHGDEIIEKPDRRDRKTLTRASSTTLQHPFTMCISGPTSCGKTYLVKCILKDLASVSPRPQRIIWLYKRWQPLYTEMKQCVRPKIEFIQGVPADLEKDTFLDPKLCNLIVLDDLMTAASKDQRVTDLFTEGSHHRNLSVIAINQNLYYSKDPTRRRNCHYIALFNNPVDQQPVMTLARQMYPGRLQTFMDAYDEAIKKPYGYLLVDLKPTTSSDERLVPNGLARSYRNDDPLGANEAKSLKPGWINFCSSSVDEEDGPPPIMMVTKPDQPRNRRLLGCPHCGALIEGMSHFTNHVLHRCKCN